MARRSRTASVPYTPPPTAVDGESKPIHTIRIGEIRASIWQSHGSDGSTFALTVDRQWREASGEWKEGHTFLASDVRHLSKAVIDSAQWIEWQQKRLAQATPAVS